MDLPLKVRLDKWLWAARFYKTRAVARMAVEMGQVIYDGVLRPSPNLEIEIGAVLTIKVKNTEKKVTIKGLSTRRRSIEDSLQLFEEAVLD